ncbi:hypothetical protein H0H93_002198 [Arthromyces matolae]|nr:hypothetical protein H0H93_002198 [Arthromyces matolae]
MSVLLETSLGDLVIDLEVDACPKTCENFLKLCKVYYYNLNAFFNVSKDFLAQVGDPTATGTGGECVWSHIASGSSKSLENPVSRYFEPEIRPKLKHATKGTVSMAVAPTLDNHKGGCGSQFFVTLADNIEYLDGKHAVFGHIVEGFDTLDKINDVYTDQDGRPFKDIRIRHVVILGLSYLPLLSISHESLFTAADVDDPFPDPPNLIQPPSSPTRPPDNSTRIAEDEDPLATLPEEEEEKIRREKAAAASALTLEMVGDLPFANVRPPENVLFVCKLNAVTRDEDLELIFSRFGTIMSCQVIRDKKTGDSLQYAFIEFDKREDAEQAYFKMQNVLVDDRRIWVDFSQSVAKLNTHWSNDIRRGSKAPQRMNSYGGRDDLEKTRRYRNEDVPSGRHGHHGQHYDMANHMGTAENAAEVAIDTTTEKDVEGAQSHRAERGDSRRCFAQESPFIVFFSAVMGAQRYPFDSPDADIILQSCEQQNPSLFHVHRCILAAGSPFFRDMFTLPQGPAVSHQIPVIPMAETHNTLLTLLEFIYPVEDPHIPTLDDLVPVLEAAVKYDFLSVIATLRKLIVLPRFVEADPTRVYAIASRFELEDEARIASKHTLNVRVLDTPLSDDLKHITAYSYHRLLDLHTRRVNAAIGLLKASSDIKCMQCNGSSYSVYVIPKWWYQFEKMAKEELSVRPTTEVIFESGFMAQVAMAAECPRCAGSILDSWKFLQGLKKAIDELPATI